ncbi:homoserine kinase [Deinococcus piscis]|uniref:Homoserine kinase n=1 Tax=Deinococcus piscis TaxID=394230 RepID=A0ABQ3KCB1_9DEIO|nr:homoserine kinase [Deinococcus piscis]GHG10869.1 homoserine kinase [Deinococcus piscis]
MTLEVRVPASSANLGPGFDCLGLSLPLYTTLRARQAPTLTVVPRGAALAGTPADATNYVYRCMEALAQEVGRPLPALHLEIESAVPLARGLGSSAAALVAALLTANAVLGEPLTRRGLLDLASRIEGHPDNVAPALLGGIVIATFDGQRAQPLRIEPPHGLGVTVLIPEFELNTAKARSVMPPTYSREDAVFTASHAALTTAALMSGRLELLAEAMQDRLHQPYRAALVPGLERILAEAGEHGALGAALSGAGPAVLCFHRVGHAGPETGALHLFLQRVMAAEGLSGRILDLPIEPDGASVLGQFGE